MSVEEPHSEEETLDEIVALFRDAERAIKYVEDFGQTLVFPAVNQLRYTGNHLVRFLATRDRTELIDASRHVKRATYDAYETAIVYQMGCYEKFKQDYQKVQVTKVIPDYVEIQGQIEDARQFIRDHNGSKTRGDHYRDGQEHLDKIKCMVHRLEVSRGELNKLIQSERTKFMLQLTGSVAAVLSVLATVIIGLLTWVGCK